MKKRTTTVVDREAFDSLPVELRREFFLKKLSLPKEHESVEYMQDIEQFLLRENTVLRSRIKWETMPREDYDSWVKRRPLDVGFNSGAHFVLNSLQIFLPIILQKEEKRNNKKINETIKLHLETIAKLPIKIRPLIRAHLLSDFKPGTIRQVELRLRRSKSKSPPPELAALVRYIHQFSEEGKLPTPERLARKLNIHRANLSRVIERAKKWGFNIQEQEDSRGERYYTIGKRLRRGGRYK